MTEKDRERGRGESEPLESLTKASLDFWESTANLWFGVMKTAAEGQGFPGAGGESGMADRKKPGAGEDPRAAFDQFWQAYFRSLQGSGDAPSGALPEMALKIMEPLWNQLASFSPPAAEERKKSFEDISEFFRKVSRAWFGSYEEEMRKYLNLPQLGLMRYYQERLNLTVDRFQAFRGRLMDFAHLFYAPIEESVLRRGEESGNSRGSPGLVPDLDRETRKEIPGHAPVARLHRNAPGDPEGPLRVPEGPAAVSHRPPPGSSHPDKPGNGRGVQGSLQDQEAVDSARKEGKGS